MLVVVESAGLRPAGIVNSCNGHCRCSSWAVFVATHWYSSIQSSRRSTLERHTNDRCMMVQQVADQKDVLQEVVQGCHIHT